MLAIIEHVRGDATIKLPKFDRNLSRPSDSALVSVGIEPNPFGGTVGEHRYQFEGEEDLLHLIVTRIDGNTFAAEEAQEVAGFVLRDLPKSLIWLRPGEYSHHFYFGHDELLRAEKGEQGA
jgi:hypothetical protein